MSFHISLKMPGMISMVKCQGNRCSWKRIGPHLGRRRNSMECSERKMMQIMLGWGSLELCIQNVSLVTLLTAYRRNFSSAFSDKALREQEPIMKKYFDLLIQRLRENCTKPVDIVQWYNSTTFDIVGDLLFGESYECLEKSRLHVSLKNDS